MIRALTSLDSSNEFIEGPCNCVSKILDLSGRFKEVKEFVELKNFDWDASNKESVLYLGNVEEEPESVQKLMSEKKAWSGPRVGLTLKKYDEHKEYFWMRDYRYVIYPEKHRKMQQLVILGMLGMGMSAPEVQKIVNCRDKGTVKELADVF